MLEDSLLRDWLYKYRRIYDELLTGDFSQGRWRLKTSRQVKLVIPYGPAMLNVFTC